MEEVIKKVIYSNTFYEDLKDIYSYGSETFGEEMGNLFQEKILHSSSGLSYMSLLHPECRQLQTKTQIYRNIILGRYLIIYRVKASKIEVLRALHSSQNPETIKAVKKIKIK
jgi:plasmid stabilization system protein ParE